MVSPTQMCWRSHSLPLRQGILKTKKLVVIFQCKLPCDILKKQMANASDFLPLRENTIFYHQHKIVAAVGMVIFVAMTTVQKLTWKRLWLKLASEWLWLSYLVYVACSFFRSLFPTAALWDPACPRKDVTDRSVHASYHIEAWGPFY